MASYTPNLNLLMKDPVADGADTFNIETMLNENWEKIDAAVLRAIAAAAAYDAGKTYQQGDFCTQGGLLYRANQVIAQPEAWTAGHWTEISITDVIRGLTAADVGAAPEGYGLGNNTGIPPEKYGNDLNNLKVCCWYVAAPGTANCPTGINLSEYGYGITLCRVGTAATQIHTFSGGIAVRNFSSETWGPWEYVNPPMQIGVEYRTTERYQGKPVYVKLIDFGTLPNATYKYVVVDNVAQVIRASGLTSDGRTLPGTVGVAQTGMITCAGVRTQVQIVTYADQSSLTATVCAWYTKATD